MADRWISTGKRYCNICKVWFGNNKISQDNHDRSEKHKAMLANRIRETMQKGKKQELADAKLNGTLARMESAAVASMTRHGEGIVQGPSLPPTGLRMNIFDPKQHKDISSMAKEMSSRRDGALKRGLSGAEAPIGGLGAPSLKVTKEDVVSAYRDLTNPSAHGPALPESHAVQYLPQSQQPTEIQWVKARSAEGTYYWNIFDKTTRWDQPAYFYTEEEYERKVQEFEESRARNYYGLDDVQAVKQGKNDVEAFIKSQIGQTDGLAAQIEANRKEMQYTDRSDRGKKAEKRRKWEEKKKKEEEEARKIEENEPQTSFYAQMLISPPPPPMPVFVKEEKEEDKVMQEEEAVKQEEKVEEEKKAVIPPVVGLGGWIRITKEEKSAEPFISPLTARYKEEEEKEKEEAEKREKEEPKFEFGEKTATVMTKKVKGPIEFKKKSTTRNIRKREE